LNDSPCAVDAQGFLIIIDQTYSDGFPMVNAATTEAN
jgi:hypothetical protein